MMSVQRLFRRNGETYNEKIKRLGNVLAEADTIVIGAGAGLSTSAGFVYDGERFEKYFQISKQNMDSAICIREGSGPTIHWKNTGRTGAGISGSTGIWMPRSRCMTSCLIL